MPSARRRTPRGTPLRAARQRDYAVARVHLWGHEVGVLSESQAGEITFEYVDAFRLSGLEISPIHLPLTQLGAQTFPSLRRVEAFAGLPGVFADALPDTFGNLLIKRYFAQHGTPDAALSPLQKLLYIGGRAIGALEFRPAIDRTAAIDEALEVASLVEQARQVLVGNPDVAVPEMMQVGASAGGARAKAMILWNRTIPRVKSAFAPMADGDEHWLLKFDGVSAGAGGHVAGAQFVPGPFGRIEYAYAQLARRAGIAMAETHLLHEREFAHFMVKRFDRHGTTRLHMHSLGGMQHADYNVPRSLSYETYFRTVRRLGMGQNDVDQAFCRMVFNVAARNQDDHVKNLAFLMDSTGTWSLAPAFDVTWAYGDGWTKTHQMTANGKDDAFTRDDLLAIGREFDVPHGGARIIDRVADALTHWREEARAVELNATWTKRIETHFRRLDRRSAS